MLWHILSFAVTIVVIEVSYQIINLENISIMCKPYFYNDDVLEGQ